MATVGSIKAVFEADVTQFQTSLRSAIASINELSTAVKGLSQSSKIQLTVDSSSAAKAAESVKTLEKSTQKALTPIRDFGKRATEAYESVADVAHKAASAHKALSETVGKTGSINSAITAAGRLRTAYKTTAEFGEGLDGQIKKLSAGFLTLAGAKSLVSVSLDAVRGKAGAAGAAIGAVSGIIAGAAVVYGSYAAITAAVSAATAGLSNESRHYVNVAVSLAAAATITGIAMDQAAVTTLRVTEAIARSGSVTKLLSDSFVRVGSAVTTAASAVGRILPTLGLLADGYTLITAAGDKATTGLGFVSLAVKVAAVRVALGSAIGVISAYAAGTSVAAGAMAGGTAAAIGLGAGLSVIAPLAIFAAVATGKFAHQLEEMSLAAQKTDQMATRFGATVNEISMLQLAAENTAVGFGQLAKAHQTFSSNLSKIKMGQMNVETVREAKLAYDALGITLETIKDKSPQEMFKLVAEQISKVEDAAQRSQIAMDLFGRQGAAIMPALKELGEVEADFKRLGGALNAINFSKMLVLENSFDRLKASGKSLATTLVLPFVDMQRAVNNLSADIRGGLASALTPIATMLADLSAPLAVAIEVFGRVLNIILRITAAVLTLVVAFSQAGAIAAIFNYIGDAIKGVLGYVEAFVVALESIAAAADGLLRPMVSSAAGLAIVIVSLTTVYYLFQTAMVQTAVTAVVSASTTAAAWAGIALGGIAVFVAAAVIGFVHVASQAAIMAGQFLASAIVMHAAWLIALGPIGAVIAAVELVIAGLAVLYMFGGSISSFFASAGPAWQKPFNAATASAKELANEAAKTSKTGMTRDLEALGLAAGMSAEQVKASMADAKAAYASVAGQERADLAFGTDTSTLEASITKARGELGGLTIEAAKFGKGGEDAASAAAKGMEKLQTKLAKGKINAEQFGTASKKLTDDLRENLDTLKSDSPDILLKKNLEVFKQLDDAAKQAAKSVRDIGAGVVIEGKFFPRSEEIKRRAAEYQAQYAAALEQIKEKQQAGGFQKELDAKRAQNDTNFFDTNTISKEEHTRVRLQLDSTNAQEQASIAAEEVKRTLDNQNVVLNIDTSFADNIRKELDTAFLSPVEKFQKELNKIKATPELTDNEKVLAEKNLRKKEKESLIGKSDSQTFSERSRDLNQANKAGLIDQQELSASLRKAADDLASALGIPLTPLSSLETSTAKLRLALDAGVITAEQFAAGMRENRDKFLSSVGIEQTDVQKDNTKLRVFNENAGGLSPDEIARGRTQQRNDIMGESAGSVMRNRGLRLDNAVTNGTISQSDRQVEMRKLRQQRDSAAGIESSPAAKLQEGIDKVNDAFDTVGMTVAEANAHLVQTGGDVQSYNAAIKKSRDVQLEALGVEKSGMQKLSELQGKLLSVGASAAETAQAMRKGNEEFMSAIGVTKTPFEVFSTAIKNVADQFNLGGKSLTEIRVALAGTPDKLKLFERAVKEARTALLSSLGIDKSPVEEFNDMMAKIAEAAARPQGEEGAITQEEKARAERVARDKRDKALGVEQNGGDFAADIKRRRDEVKDAFGPNILGEFAPGNEDKFRQANAAIDRDIPGAQKESPITKFKRDMERAQAVRDLAGIPPVVAVGRAPRLTPEQRAAQQQFGEQQAELRAQLQEDLEPALRGLMPNRDQLKGADARSTEGVDTFFRILRGSENPTLRAQLEANRNLRIIADAQRNPNVAPLLPVQLQPRGGR